MFGRLSKNNQLHQKQHQMPVVMGYYRQQLPIQQSQTTQLTQYAPSDGHKMRWGKPTWLFFHTLAYKIKPEAFPLIREQTLQIINQICSSLPCPMCSTHAKDYLKKINFNAIRTKSDFIDLFYNFHNTVNSRKRFKPFAKEDMDSVYAGLSVINTFNDFMRVYSDKQKGFRLMADNMVRSQNLNRIINWFQSILPYLEQ